MPILLVLEVGILTIFFLGMMSAAASLGLGLLWDTDVGLSHIDRYTYSPEEWIKVLFTPCHRAYLLIV